MSQDETLAKQAIESAQHFTEPPPRFSEAALVKRMEELGIGRPSTYASVLQVLQDRGYVRIDKKRLLPEDKGRVVVAFLESFFTRYVEYDFTAGLEEKLDRISNGEIDWRAVLAEFWQDFIGSVNEIKEVRNRVVLDALNDLLEPHIFPVRADGVPRRQCPQCNTGQLSLKTGRFGAFVGCSNYPDCNFTRQISPSADGVQGKKVLGEDPVTGLEVTLRGGRFGPYLQLGEQIKPPKPKKGEKKQEVEKPKRASVPKGVVPDDIDLEKALALLSLPREVGLSPEDNEPILAGVGRFGPYVKHGKIYASLEKALALLSLPREVGLSPEDNEPILAGVGRFGPYVKHGKIYASLEEGDDVLTVGLNRAVTLIAEKKANPKKGRRFGADPGRSLGEHPDKGGPVLVKNGRYGPYVSNNGINATITGDKTPETITLTEAVVLLDARAEAIGSQPRRAAGRKKPGTPAAAPKGRKAKAAAEPGDLAAAKPRKTLANKTSAKKPAAKKKPVKVTAAE